MQGPTAPGQRVWSRNRAGRETVFTEHPWASPSVTVTTLLSLVGPMGARVGSSGPTDRRKCRGAGRKAAVQLGGADGEINKWRGGCVTSRWVLRVQKGSVKEGTPKLNPKR